MADSIFTQIIKGEIPSHKIYEDELTLAFLDIHPLVQGHVLVIPKKQVDQFDDLPAEDYAALFETVRKVSKRLKETLHARRAVVTILGFDVPHAHVHITPFNSAQAFYKAVAEASKGDEAEPDHTALASLAQTLAF